MMRRVASRAGFVVCPGHREPRIESSPRKIAPVVVASADRDRLPYCATPALRDFAVRWTRRAHRGHVSLSRVPPSLSLARSQSLFHLSGVLSCVCAALFLSAYAWPFINTHHGMHRVWHTFEVMPSREACWGEL